MNTDQQGSSIPPPNAVNYAFPANSSTQQPYNNSYQSAPGAQQHVVYVQPAPIPQPHHVHSAVEKSRPDALVWGFSGSMLVVIFVVFLLCILVGKFY